jgi:O-methyltransferase
MSTTDAPTEARHNLLQKVALVPRYVREKQGTPWDLAPRRRDLRDPAGYLHAMRLHHRLLREGYTMISSRRARALQRVARQVVRDGIPGALVDCGVWNGGSTILLSEAAPDREVWAFDSFEGLPEAGPLDGPESAGWKGECLGGEDKLREGFRHYASPQRLHVVKGWFDETFPVNADDIGPVAVLHADGDWYESVMLTLRTFYPRVAPGGYVVIDDYGAWPGAMRAVDEVRREVGDSAPMVAADFTGRYWRKLR